MQQNAVIIQPLRAAQHNKNRNHCERPINMDIFVSKMQGTISRKFTEVTPQNIEVIIAQHHVGTTDNYKLQK